MKALMRSTRRAKARRWWGVVASSCSSEEEVAAAAMTRKSVVPVRAFQPACLLRISSAREMWRSFVEAGESLPTLLA